MADDHIIRVDLEDRFNKYLRNPDTMLHYIHDKIKDKELYYIIIDEVPLIDEFVDVLNSFSGTIIGNLQLNPFYIYTKFWTVSERRKPQEYFFFLFNPIILYSSSACVIIEDSVK